MTLLMNISKFLSQSKVQRICYAMATGLWLLVFMDTFQHFDAISSIGIKYLWLALVPICLLIAQVILNSKVIWFMIVGLIMSFTFYAIGAIIKRVIERSTDQLKPLTIDITDVFVILIYFGLLAIVNWIVIQLRPARRRDNTNAQHQL